MSKRIIANKPGGVPKLVRTDTNHAVAAPKSKTPKRPCSLCHQVVEELKYHYDICEPCHQDMDEEEDSVGSRSEHSANQNGEPADYGSDSEGWEEDSDDVLSEEEKDDDVIQDAVVRIKPVSVCMEDQEVTSSLNNCRSRKE